MTDAKQRGEVLKNARKKKNMTQAQLGERLGVKLTTISGYELGTRSPDLDKLIVLCKELDLEPIDLGFHRRG